MDLDEKGQKFYEWASLYSEPFAGNPRLERIKGRELREALYAASETGQFPDGEATVSNAQAILCWKIIERLRNEKFPPELIV